MDKATVIIPCYNVAAYILDCLDSVVLQGEVVHHTYVVDNNSTDDTINKVREWQKSNPNFPLTLLDETKPGAPAARNLPLALVETKWIQFLDADDILLRNKIADQIRCFSDSDVICASAQRIDKQGNKKLSIPNPNIPVGLVQSNLGITSSNLFASNRINEISGWDETIKSSQEYDLMFRLWQRGAKFETDTVPRAPIRARQTGQISQRNPSEKWRQFIDLRIEMISFFRTSKALNEIEMNQCHEKLFDFLRILAKHDFDAAVTIYNEVFKPIDFKPTATKSNSKVYLIFFRIFGFAAAERLKKLLDGLLPS